MAMFHAVSIRAGSEHACPAVQELENVRFLSEDAPMLPLEGCGARESCRCTYVHFEDRRTDMRREADIGLPQRRREHERRIGMGRRITD